jgi:hypothetical protein
MELDGYVPIALDTDEVHTLLRFQTFAQTTNPIFPTWETLSIALLTNPQLSLQ